MALWAGRFQGALDERADDFNASISFDCVMAQEDIAGSIAHATMLGEQGILQEEDARAIVQGLKQMAQELASGALSIDPHAEDIHTFVETELTARIGEAGKRLHTARSRNDQVSLDLRMYLKRQTRQIQAGIVQLMQTLIALAQEHVQTIMPGYTHLQIAQPVTLAHHLLAYGWMLQRDFTRLSDAYTRMDVMPLGSGALAATTYPLCRERVAELLGFANVSENSLDGVSDRDFCVELGCALALLMVHLSRLCEELVLWCSSEFHFVELDDAFSTGSSIMPQKKNPDVAELIRGKAGRVNGNLMALLTMLKGLPLAYNKDMQEDKQAIFDSVQTVLQALKTLPPMLSTMTVHTERMRQAAARGFINATDCADYLVQKGLPFRDAYKLTGQLVRYCLQNGQTLETLPLQTYKAASELFEADVYAAIDLEQCVARRSVRGGPAPEAVQRQTQALKAYMRAYQMTVAPVGSTD